MTDQAWERLVDLVDVKFGLLNHGRDRTPLEDKPELTQTTAFVEFKRGEQHYRLERVSRPAVVEQKSHFHRAAASKVRLENIYDPEQISHKVQLFIKQGDNWQPLDLEELSLAS